VSFTIRKAVVADSEGVLRCLHAAFEPYCHLYTPEGFADTTLTPATLSTRLQEMTIFVAETDSGEIVGTIACQRLPATNNGEGHIRGMAVLPDWHGEGVAEELLSAAETELLGAGCSFVSLDTTAPLQRAIRFYERNGYRRSGKVCDFYGMPLYEYVRNLSSSETGRDPKKI
jgi:ribosomal protein S18 acetylase RimI-like enzyme